MTKAKKSAMLWGDKRLVPQIIDFLTQGYEKLIQQKWILFRFEYIFALYYTFLEIKCKTDWGAWQNVCRYNLHKYLDFLTNFFISGKKNTGRSGVK